MNAHISNFEMKRSREKKEKNIVMTLYFRYPDKNKCCDLKSSDRDGYSTKPPHSIHFHPS